MGAHGGLTRHANSHKARVRFRKLKTSVVLHLSLG